MTIESNIRRFAASRAAETRKRNREVEQARIERNRIARIEHEKREAIERPIREAKQAQDRAQWIRFWRGKVCDAMDVSYPPTAAARLDKVIVEMIQWGGYAGLGTPFTSAETDKLNYIP